MSRRRAALGALLAIVALALGACGGDDSGAASSEATVTSSDNSQKTVVVQSRDGAFDPQAIYQQAAPGVVTVRSILSGGGTSLLDGGGSAALGSGFVVSDAGEIATNAHVVTDGSAGGGPIQEAKEVYVQFADRNQVAADIVGFDPHADVALLKVDPDGLDLRPLELATDEEVKVGQPVAAIGSPFGEDRSLSVGVVSATNRSIQSLTQFQIDGAIQTDASINPGNSGGPLLDADGHVIGIDQQINTTSGGNEGVGFAVPVALVARSIDQLRENGSVKYAYIGVTTQSLYPQLADRLGLDRSTGALVTKVVDGSPAADAGLEAGKQEIEFQGLRATTGGDVIVAVDGDEIVGETDLPRLIAQHDPGDTVTVEIVRDGETRSLDVELGERPEGVR
ncbi:MAG: trypsin-like peptidase domain-containing protein [Actinomycetota bacterium]